MAEKTLPFTDQRDYNTIIAEQKALEHITEFLNPFTGGHSGQGWNFGVIPCLSDFYLLFDNISEIDHVDNLSVIITIEKINGDDIFVLSETTTKQTIPSIALLYGSDHTIDLKWVI